MEVQNSSKNQKVNDEQIDSPRNFHVVKNLKNTEQQYAQLRNRINILKFNDDSNTKKLQNNIQKIQKLQLIRNQADQKNQKLNQLRKTRVVNIENQKKKNKQFKQTITNNTHAIMQVLKSEKAQNHDQLRMQSKNNHKKIESLRMESVQQRKMLRQAAALAESRSKQKINDYTYKKHKTLHEEQDKQNMALNKKKEKKLAQIQSLEKVEMEMIKKYSESQYAFTNVKNKLDQMLGKVKNQKSMNRKINDKQQPQITRSESFYALNQRKSKQSAG